jgi:GMP synthase-like glutamine amidotransferase
VIQHLESAPAGHVSDWLAERGADEDVWRIDAEDRPVAPRDYDLIVSLGSECAAYDDSVPWIARELGLLRDAAGAGVPVLGICFGSQLLARALGGRAMRAPQPEIGWFPVRTRDRAFVEEGPWLQWHYDTFTPPPGAALLADSDAGPQAYSIGACLGLQFHPEVAPEIVEGWVAKDRDELVRHGIEPDRLLAQTRERASESRAAAWALLDTFLHQVAATSVA